MSECYWVGNSGNWSDNTHHWSATSNGSPGASLPTSADNVHFDQYSFTTTGQTVTVDATSYCRDMDWTGVLHSPVLAITHNLRVYGNVVLSNLSTSGTDFFMFLGSGTQTLKSNGVAISATLGCYGGGTLSLQDDALFYGGTDIGSTLLTTNNYNIDLNWSGFSVNGYGNVTLNLGSSHINNVWDWSINNYGYTIILNAGTSIIQIVGTDSFNGYGLTYHEVDINSASQTISGSNTFSTLSLASGTTQTITFTDGTTQTATTFNLSGSSGHVHTLQGSSTGGWNIIKSGGGTVTMDYVAVTYSTASPDTTFYDYTHGTDNGHNTHWYFTNGVLGYKLNKLIATGVL